MLSPPTNDARTIRSCDSTTCGGFEGSSTLPGLLPDPEALFAFRGAGVLYPLCFGACGVFRMKRPIAPHTDGVRRLGTGEPSLPQQLKRQS